VQPETPPQGLRGGGGGGDGHDPHGAGSGGAALLETVRRLLLAKEEADAEGEDEEDEQGQFPKRWAIVFLCFSAFLICNMDRVRASANQPPTPSLLILFERTGRERAYFIDKEKIANLGLQTLRFATLLFLTSTSQK
jgi:hypothetical protein